MKVLEMNLGEVLEMVGNQQEESEPKLGPVQPLNEEAIAEQKRHAKEVDLILTAGRAAARAMRDAKERLEEEQARWYRNMVQAMPELAQGEGFSIGDDGRSYQAKLGDEAPTKTPPQWAQELAAMLAAGEKPDVTH